MTIQIDKYRLIIYFFRICEGLKRPILEEAKERVALEVTRFATLLFFKFLSHVSFRAEESGCGRGGRVVELKVRSQRSLLRQLALIACFGSRARLADPDDDFEDDEAGVAGTEAEDEDDEEDEDEFDFDDDEDEDAEAEEETEGFGGLDDES